MTTGLFWFTNDLRLQDQPALWKMQSVDKLICVFCLDPQWFRPNGLNAKAMGERRFQFLVESLKDLQQQLQHAGQVLIIKQQTPHLALTELINKYNVDIIARSQHAGVYENRHWKLLQQQFPDRKFITEPSHTLFSADDLPFQLNQLPTSFTQFRKQVEDLALPRPMSSPQQLPPPPGPIAIDEINQPVLEPSKFTGGETAALKHINDYFSTDLPANYKTVRNELDGWTNSTKFSPWLALGCLSVRHLASRLKNYEQTNVSNDSTYWIYFELLWREYFQWYAHCYGARLFRFNGIKNSKSRRCYYPERYQKWCNGNTPYPLVNACMKQLNATGYMSNRGRQIVASCFVHELNLDWRFGAAYFEQQLIDYDVAANWGNWQYIAGVGADPRGGRQFNIEKQTRQYDPEGEFIRHWQGDIDIIPLDSVDAADWPIMPPPKK
ncbi:DASH family cryptochrome [Methylophaga nitratireducenticrescens]|uniref:DASH family cryptochrome n=1 Tax=Methylophaga nitratireducenticrescens TaxID=754476 RepID=UPI000CDC4EDF|nr:DASH family cryptochrome [Methylophaga nitratireducenticrescens]AUZ84467.1 deoxyribodipyrimidine photolyase [Methylophaga nitratireducenticrescens]